MKPLILVGGGGHCMSVIEAAESCGREIMGILDLKEYVGSKISGYEIIGTDDEIAKYADTCEFIISVGSIKSADKRKSLYEAMLRSKAIPATVIASTAYISKRATVMPGTVVLHHATVNAGAFVGNNCIINTAANIEHSVRIGNHTHISTGAMINGDCEIGACSFIGSGARINNGINITSNSVVGSGATVIKDITKSGIYAGVPAIYIHK